MRPIVSYYGGKQRIASWIVSHLPPHTVYVESFAGGASVLFAKPRPVITNADHYREVLNDHDERIITVYRCCQDPITRQSFMDRLLYTPHSRAEYAKAKTIINQQWDESDFITRAWAVVVSLQQSFANKLNGGWNTGVFSGNHAVTWENWRKHLPDLMERLCHVYLECDDALSVIRRWDSPQTVHYCDPPYLGAVQGHYKGYDITQYQALLDVLAHCQGSVVLSGYPNPYVPHDWPCEFMNAYCSASGQGKTRQHDRQRAATSTELGDRRRTECLWILDRSAGVRTELAWMRQPQAELFQNAGEADELPF